MIHNLPTNFLPGEFKLTPGRASDYHTLARFHYAPRPPATFAAVVCARWCNPVPGHTSHAINPPTADNPLLPRCSASCRPGSEDQSKPVNTGAAHSAASAARAAAWQGNVAAWYGDCEPLDGSRLIAVAVLSYPSALHRVRHRVFGLRHMKYGERLRWVNANLRTISRVIIHPQFRGIGLSTALIQAAVDLCPTRYVEAAARMGRAHPLFERAGFNRAEPVTDDEAIYYWRDRDTQSETVPTFRTPSLV